jgi:hypothetical protein
MKTEEKGNLIIGIYNISTTLWFVITLTCGGLMTYFAIDSNLFSGNLIFIAKFFIGFIIGFIILFATGVLIFLLLKFRILFIRKNKLYSIRPFIFKLQKIDLTSKLKIKWDTWQLARSPTYRTVRIVDQEHNMTKLSDAEFENFDAIINLIDKSENNDKRTNVEYLQAKENICFMYLDIACYVVLFVVIVWLNFYGIFHWIHVVVYFILLLLFFSAVTKRKRYKRIIKLNNSKLELEMNNED